MTQFLFKIQASSLTVKVAAPMEAPIDDLGAVDEKFLCYIPPLLCKLDGKFVKVCIMNRNFQSLEQSS